MGCRIFTHFLTSEQILETQLLELSGNRFVDQVHRLADKIHESWQAGARESGLEERWKDIKILSAEALTSYIKTHPDCTKKGPVHYQVNILALSNRELPLEHQTENLRAAAHAIGAWQAFLSGFEPASLKRNLESITNVFNLLPLEALRKDAEEIGWIEGFMQKDETDFNKNEFNAIALTASKTHEAWIERASSWLEPSSNQAKPFFALNNYNQRADLAILTSLAEIRMEDWC